MFGVHLHMPGGCNIVVGCGLFIAMTASVSLSVCLLLSLILTSENVTGVYSLTLVSNVWSRSVIGLVALDQVRVGSHTHTHTHTHTHKST